MTQSLVLTGTTSYLVLALAIILTWPAIRDATSDEDSAKAAAAILPIVTGCGYFLIGAIVGLLQRAYGELGLKSEVEDFGLSTARLLHAPIVSGLAAVGGTLLTAIVAAPPVGLSLLDAAAGRSLLNAFSLTDYPMGVVVAAVFGLTPALLLERLVKIGEGLKTDIQTSTAAGQQTGSGDGS